MNTIETTVGDHLNFVTAMSAETSASKSARSTFELSATSFAAALDSGISANALGKAIKEATTLLEPRDRGLAYTSAAAVGFHARTGRVLLLDDDLASDFDVREFQTAIKKLPTAVVDEILEDTETRGEALSAFTAALDDQDKPEPKEPKVKDIAALLKAASGSTGKALELRLSGEDMTDEGRVFAAQIVASLSTLLATTVAVEKVEVDMNV